MKYTVKKRAAALRKALSLMLAAVLLASVPFPVSSLEDIPFTDVQPDQWHYEAVSYVYETALFNGTGNGKFSPNAAMTRGMFVQVLANMAGADCSAYTLRHFADVKPGKWYMGAVEWAANYGITSGTRKFVFNPEGLITREQIAALLYRFASATGNDTAPGDIAAEFSDYSRVSPYARDAVDWAVSHGLLQGVGGGMLKPRDQATRAQTAQIFYNARELFPNKEIIAEPVELPLPNDLEIRLYSMSLEEKVGQLFLPGYPGADSAQSMARKYFPAGYVFLERDFRGKTRTQVKDMTAKCQQASKTPMFISADEEGGTVVRVSTNPNLAPKPYDSPQDVYRRGGLSGVTADTKSKSELLLDLGVNLNLAPVCDVSTDPNDFIYQRSLGLPAKDSATVIAAMVRVMEESGISGSLKHFPGYGNNKDTHTGISVDKRPYEQFVREDFLPFRSGIEAGAPSVMVSHNIINCMDGSRPASLSKAVHDVLRNELGFEGVIMTDALAMDAVSLYTGGRSPAVEAFLAGNDMLLTGNWVSDYNALLAAVKSGKVSLTDIEASVMRILTWKQSKGLL